MRHSLIVCAALFLSGFSASAIPAMDQLDIQLEGEAEGWLNATCTYYGGLDLTDQCESST